ncbi:MAG: hypothetical protein RIC35_09045 [Marinoscillum sp.]
MTAEVGIVCALTSEKPAFEDKCADFKIDQAEADRIIKLEQEVEYEEELRGYFEMEQRVYKKVSLGESS